MTQVFNDGLYLIDLSYLNTPSEVVYDLSSILDTDLAKNRRIRLNLGNVDFNKSQLLSIKSLIESINSTLTIIEGESEATKNSAIAIGLVYQNPKDINIEDDKKAEDTGKEPELFPNSDSLREKMNENINQDNEIFKTDSETEDLEKDLNSVEHSNQEIFTQESDIQNFESGFSNNNWANPIINNKNNTNENENINENIESKEIAQTEIPKEINDEENEKNIELTGIQTLADIPLDIPNDKTIQEELNVIYKSESKLEDIFANTGLKEEKFQSLKDTPNAEEKEYTQYDFEIEAFPTKYLKQTICTGQYIAFEGNLVIIGDCHEGSEISAAGDVTVWGELSGSVHAGKNGNEKCKIRALKMNASQLRISNCYIKRPQVLNNQSSQKTDSVPEEAMISNGEIVVYKIYK